MKYDKDAFASPEEQLEKVIRAFDTGELDQKKYERLIGPLVLKIFQKASPEERAEIDRLCYYANGHDIHSTIAMLWKEVSGHAYTGTLGIKEQCLLADVSPFQSKRKRIAKVDVLPGVYNCYASVASSGRVRSSWIIHRKYDVPDAELRSENFRRSLKVFGFGYFDSFRVGRKDITSFGYASYDSRGGVRFYEYRYGFYTGTGRRYTEGFDVPLDVTPLLWKNAEGETVGIEVVFPV